MTALQFERWQELREIVKTSNSMSEIYSCCKEMIALQEGYKVVIVPLDPKDNFGTRSIYKGKEIEERTELLNTLEATLKKL